jgi:hypothetical protein
MLGECSATELNGSQRDTILKVNFENMQLIPADEEIKVQRY